MMEGLWGLGVTVRGKLFTLTVARWVVTNWPDD